MELLLNDLSIHEQFHDVSAFREAIGRIMAMRNVASQFGRELQCHRNIVNRQVTPALSMYQAIQTFTVDQKQALMQWMQRHGPFWEDTRAHAPDDYLECNGDVVTDTAVGEAAYCCIRGIDRHLVSLTPSSWQISPVTVKLVSDTTNAVEVANWWEMQALESALRNSPAPISSWDQLRAVSMARFPHLTFSADSFAYLRGHPFVPGAAHRIISLLDTLDRLMSCVDESGQRTPKGHQLYQDHFTGDKASFSDSSYSEKNEFQGKLTFRHPEAAGQFLFCTWHGKVNNPPLRVHFSWPERGSDPLYVMYVGWKITRR